MASHKNGLILVPPPNLEKRLEALQAAREVLAREHELARRRRDEIAALRRHLEELRRSLGPIRQRLESEARSDVLRMLKYNADEARVPAGEHGGGQWTSGGGGALTNDAGNAPAAAAPPGSQRGPQYAQAEPGTRTDATDGSGNVSAAAAQQYPDFVHDVGNAIKEVFARISRDDRHFDKIPSRAIPAESPKHAEPFLDSSDQEIPDDKGNRILRPADLPPETYVQAGLAAKSRNLADAMHELAELAREHPNITAVEDESSKIARLSAMVAIELSPFVHAGSLDAERFDHYYVEDYRHYTSIALGIFMAAAGVSKEDMLTIADEYAREFSHFHEQPDERYTHSTKQDVQDNLRGYELYEAGRIRPPK